MIKDSSWRECIESKSSISITPNKAKAKSLFETASGRIKYLEKSKINDESANYIFE